MSLNFYQMLEKLNEAWDGGYKGQLDRPEYDEEDIYYNNLLIGEEEDSPCTLHVSGDNENWLVDKGTGVFVNNYSLTGKEDAISKPESFENGVDFKNPGRKLENLPEDVRDKCVEFIDGEIKNYLINYNKMIKNNIEDERNS